MRQTPESVSILNGGPDTHVAPLLPATAPPPEPARKINFFKALLLHWLVPRRYGPHLAVASWKRALAAHVISMVILAAAMVAILPLATQGMNLPRLYTVRE